jgi:hypothetical protein
MIRVDYDQTFKHMVAAGHYDFVNPGINAKQFPIHRHDHLGGICGEVVMMVHFDYTISTPAVLVYLSERHLRPIWIEELLAIGAQYPDLQYDRHIVCLGSAVPVDDEPVLGKELLVPCLFGYGSHERRLGINTTGNYWEPYFQFACVSLN